MSRQQVLPYKCFITDIAFVVDRTAVVQLVASMLESGSDKLSAAHKAHLTYLKCSALVKI